MSGWYGVDLDGTLAVYDKWEGPTVIGAPVPKMVQRVKRMIAEGKDVRIFTARAYPLGTNRENTPNDERVDIARAAVNAVQQWCYLNLGKILAVTCVKDYECIEIIDDRARQCIKNTGELVDAEDTKRLNWFEADWPRLEIEASHEWGWMQLDRLEQGGGANYVFEGKSVRDVIDQAMSLPRTKLGNVKEWRTLKERAERAESLLDSIVDELERKYLPHDIDSLPAWYGRAKQLLRDKSSGS